MSKPAKFEVDARALGAGCVAMVTGAVLAVLALMIVLSINGVGVARLRPGHIPAAVRSESVRWTGYILRCVICVLVGYVTARCARRSQMAHALILGISMMLLGALTFAVPSFGAVPDFWGAIILLLTIPLTLYGAQLAIRRGEPQGAGT